MSFSLPSNHAIVADVPEVERFDTPTFHYNYFTPDESLNDAGTIPQNLRFKPEEFFDTQQNNEKVTRTVPRYVRFEFSPVVADDDPEYIRGAANNAGLIRGNLDKIVTEDNFTNRNFVGVNFEPVDFGRRLYLLASGTATALGVGEDITTKSGRSGKAVGDMLKAARRVNMATTENVPSSFLLDALMRPTEAGYQNLKQKPVADPYEDLAVRMQIDSRVGGTMLGTSLFDPLSTFNEEIKSLHGALKASQQKAIAQTDSRVITNTEFDPPIRYISSHRVEDGTAVLQTGTRIVGYIIDKFELTADGYRTVDPPIVVESPRATSAVDPKVKYGTTYAYSIRAIAEVKLPSFTENSDGDLEASIVTLLVSSRPTARRYVRLVETDPPPPPADLTFAWDYERRALNIIWTLPVNSTRDIKKYQVFRRKTTGEGFELLQTYDFDDSQVRYFDPENDMLEAARVTRCALPISLHIDEEFDRDSAYIYTVASIDAHGLSSAYAQQYHVRFDKFTNKLVKRLVSPSGAPKAYPNMYLMADTFVDAISESRKTKVKIYMDPDFLSVVQDDGSSTETLKTDKTGGFYRLQLLNTDLQKQRNITINISDRRMAASEYVPPPAPPVGKALEPDYRYAQESWVNKQ